VTFKYSVSYIFIFNQPFGTKSTIGVIFLVK